MDNDVLTLDTLQQMAEEIAAVLMKRAENRHQQVELQVKASHVESGVCVQIDASTADGQMLFAIQAQLHGAWLGSVSELNLRSVVFNGTTT